MKQRLIIINGGVSDPVPVSVAKRFNPKIIIAVDIGEILTQNKPNHVFGLIKRSLEISHIHLSDKASQQADILIKFAFQDIGTFNDELNNHIYQEGRR